MTETSEQTRDRIIEAMGEPLGEVHHLLRNHLVDLHVTWLEYRTLFATDEKTVALLNNLAPPFFACVQTIFWHEVLLGICRLTDDPEMRRKQNLSVQRLPALLEDQQLCRKVDAALSRTKASTEFARDWRNRRLGHLDLDRARDPEAHPLQPAGRQSVEDALASLRDLMNLVEGHYLDSTTAYEHTIAELGDAESLVFWLNKAASLKTRP